MCGIFGIVPKSRNGLFKNHQDMFQDMMYAGAVRGWDATGVIGVMNDGDFGIMKEANQSAFFRYSFYNSKLDNDLFKKGSAAIGHNRAKTIGKNEDQNAHPFVVDNTFAMVHNGTLRNHHLLAKTEVDSEALAITIKDAMDEEDWKTALETALGKVEGAYAVAWYDQKRDEMCLLRNKERPLTLIVNDTGVMFCSESPMGQWISLRHNSKVEKVIPIPEHTLIRFDLEKGGACFDQIPLTLKLPKTYHGGYQNGTNTSATSKWSAADSIKKAKGPVVPLKNAVGKVDMSKNLFKKFRKLLEGKDLTFEADDWIDAVFPFDDNNKKFLVMGEVKNFAFDLTDYNHIIKTKIDTDELGMSPADLDSQVKWIGRVSDVKYIPKQRLMEVYLESCMPIIKQQQSPTALALVEKTRGTWCDTTKMFVFPEDEAVH